MRPVVGNPFENQIPTVSPTAKPVDTYVRVATNADNPFATLADTLKSFEAKAVPALREREKVAIDREVKEGQRLYEENRLAIGEAVKKGLIPEGASPYIRKGYRISQMNTMSMRYADELERALETQKLYTNGDPAKIEAFVAKFQKDFIANNGMGDFTDSEVSQYFGVNANKANEAFRDAWQDRHITWQRAQAYKAFEAEVAGATVNLFSADQTPEERQVALDSLSKFLEGRAGSMSIDGMNNAQVIDTILTGVGLAVEKTGDTDILDVFNKTKFGTAAASSSLKVQGRMMDIANKAITIQERMRVARERQIDQANEQVRATVGQTYFDYMQNPSQEGRDALEQQMATLAGTGVEKNVDEANSIRTLLSQFDKGLDGSRKTSESEIQLDFELSQARDEAQVRKILGRYGHSELISDSDVFIRLDYWRRNYDPALDKIAGLDFQSSSTVEGEFADLFASQILGNPNDYKEQNLSNSIKARVQFTTAFRNAVNLYKAQNNGQMPDDAWKTDMALKVQENLIGTYQQALKDESGFVYSSLPNLYSNNNGR